MAISDGKYMALTTYRRSGEGVTSPVWVVALEDGRVGFWTSSTSGKVKRLRNSSRVRVEPCDGRGRPISGSSPIDGTAELVIPPLPEIVTKVKAKYGFMAKFAKVLQRLAHPIANPPYADVTVAITLAS